jgi:HSP20 family protein
MIRKARGAHLEVARIQSEVNRLFETLLRLREGEDDKGGWAPAVDVSETPTHLVLEAELPGVDPESVDIRAESGDLIVRGVRPPPEARLVEGAEVLHDEHEYGAFERIVPLSTAVNTRAATARLHQGVLRVEFPRVANRRGQAVPIVLERD